MFGPATAFTHVLHKVRGGLTSPADHCISLSTLNFEAKKMVFMSKLLRVQIGFQYSRSSVQANIEKIWRKSENNYNHRTEKLAVLQPTNNFTVNNNNNLLKHKNTTKQYNKLKLLI